MKALRLPPLLPPTIVVLLHIVSSGDMRGRVSNDIRRECARSMRIESPGGLTPKVATGRWAIPHDIFLLGKSRFLLHLPLQRVILRPAICPEHVILFSRHRQRRCSSAGSEDGPLTEGRLECRGSGRLEQRPTAQQPATSRARAAGVRLSTGDGA